MFYLIYQTFAYKTFIQYLHTSNYARHKLREVSIFQNDYIKPYFHYIHKIINTARITRAFSCPQDLNKVGLELSG